MAYKVGAVQFQNFMTANSLLANMEYSYVVSDIADDFAKIVGGWSLGKSPNWTSDKLDDASPNGIIFARSENFSIQDTKFCFYEWDDDAASLGPCSQCNDDVDNDIGSYTTKVVNLWYDPSSVDYRIRWHYWQTAIIMDLDSTTTNQVAGLSWATPNLPHNNQPECVVDTSPTCEFGCGLICDGSVQVRSVWFYGYYPNTFTNKILKIINWSSDKRAIESGDFDAYLGDGNNFSNMYPHGRIGGSNTDVWAVPYVTGYSYRLSWGEHIDFKRMIFCTSDRWEAADDPMFFYFNVTDKREAINITTLDGDWQFLNETLSTLDVADLLDDLDSVDIVDPVENTMDERRRQLTATVINPGDALGGMVTGRNYIQNTTVPQYGIVAVSGVEALYSGFLPIDN